MAIQNRRGNYEDFVPSKMLPGEFAVVQNGDPNSTDGKAVYMAFQTGDVKRLATYNELQTEVSNAAEEIAQDITDDFEQQITPLVNSASQSASNASASATQAQNIVNSAVADIQAAGTTQVAAVQAKGDEVLDSIPADYTDLSDDVTALKADLNRTGELLSDGFSPLIYDTVHNEYVGIPDGAFISYNGYTRSGYIEVQPSETIYYYTSVQSAYNIFYDENHQKIKNQIMYTGTLSDGSDRYMYAPDNAKYFAFSNTDAGFEDTKIWRNPQIIDDSSSVGNKTLSSGKIRSLAQGEPKIIFPSECYAVVGSEFNIYYENVLVCDDINNYSVCPFIYPYTNITYDVFSDRLRIVPTDSMVGTYTVRFTIKKKNQEVFAESIYKKSITLHIIPKSALTGKNVIFIGDSLTNAGYYPYEIQEVLSESGVTSLGTRISTPWIGNVQKSINHEGRGGWSAMDYTSLQSSDGVPNAFWNPSTSAFDFSYYMTQQGYPRPDIVFLNLGTNGVEQPDNTVTAIKGMIASIHAYDSTIPVLVSLITPPATQDGFTYASHGSFALKFEIYQRKLNERYIAEFDGVMTNVYVSPVYFNLDRYHDFNTQQFPVSARNPELVTLQTNNIHPSQYGYYKFADVYWAMIQHLLG